MSRKYDIAQRIAEANQKPTIVIDDDHEFVVNNGKSVVIMVMALVEEMDIKTEEETEEESNKRDIESEIKSMEAMDKIMDLVFKKKEVEYIKSLDLTFPAYQLIIEAIMAAFGNKELEEVEEAAEKK